MRLLLTRPIADAAPLADRLRAAGHAVAIEPMLEIVARPVEPLDLAGVQALLLTSANAVRALGQRAPLSLPAFCVGGATAEAARAAGFNEVASAEGDARALAALVRTRLRPADGALLHPGGAHLAGDLAGDLGEAGFEVRRQVLYEARQAARLSPACAAALSGGGLDAILFFSPRSAGAFARLAAAQGLEAACGGTEAFCLSEAVAAALGRLSWRRIRIAARPEQEALLALLDEGTET